MVQKYLYNDTNRPKNAPITVQKGTYVCTKATFYLTFNPKSITYSNDIQPRKLKFPLQKISCRTLSARFLSFFAEHGRRGFLYAKMAYMKLTKKQVRILIATNCVVLVLFVGILFLPWVNPFIDKALPVEGNPDGPPVTVPHDPFRAPRPGTDSALTWETNLGGSGNDTVVAAFETASGVLVFGNTKSTDFDFKDKTPGGFAMLLGANGRAASYLTYESEISKVYALEDGFLLCYNNTTEGGVLKTDALGTETARVNLRESAAERVIDVYEDFFSQANQTEPYHAVIEYTNPGTGYKELRINVLSNKLESKYKRWFSRAQSLEYVAAYPHPGGFYLLANLKGPVSSLLTYYNWKKTTAAGDYDNLVLSLIDRYTCEAIVPAGNGRYAALIKTANNVPYLIDCYQDFKRYSIHELGAAPIEKAMLLADADTLYAYMYRLGDISALYRFDENLSVKDEVAALKKLTGLFCHTVTSRGTLLCGKTVNGISVAGINTNGVAWESAFVSQNEKIIACIETTGGLILIGESTEKGYNVGGNFGETDIWATKLSY